MNKLKMMTTTMQLKPLLFLMTHGTKKPSVDCVVAAPILNVYPSPVGTLESSSHLLLMSGINLQEKPLPNGLFPEGLPKHPQFLGAVRWAVTLLHFPSRCL